VGSLPLHAKVKEELSHAVPAVWRGSALARVLLALAQALAVAGGLVLFAMIALTVVSVLGRRLFAAPVQGDFELVQLGCAVCVACFLPYCQVQRGHVIVDFLTLKSSAATKALLDGIAATLLALCAAFVAWRLGVGTFSVRAAQESSMILGVPIWWAYAPMVLAFALLAAVALYCAWHELFARKAA
jgi:TRAP-type C4-dicarboxylate transport system permease small subunit